MSKASPIEMLERAAPICKAVLAKNNNRLEYSAQPDCPCVTANPDIIQQLLVNLCTNAGRHTKNGVVKIRASHTDGTHAARQNDEPQPAKPLSGVLQPDDSVTFEVTDNGSGIAPDLLPRVFERNVSGDGKGGLGLAICSDIIRQHGGTIEIENVRTGGVLVRFTLPVATEEGM